jgi:hypothetical protein
LIDFGLPTIGFRYNSGNRPPVPSDPYRFAPLYGVKNLGQMGLGFRGLNIAHAMPFFQLVDLTGRFMA